MWKEKTYDWKGLHFDTLDSGQIIKFDGRTLYFSPSLSTLLYYLARAQGRVLTREYMYAQLYPFDSSVLPKILDVYIVQLRHKLFVYQLPFKINTVWGRGWNLERIE